MLVGGGAGLARALAGVLGVLGALAMLVGCAVGPNYRTPQIATPGRYGELTAVRSDTPLSLPEATEGDLTRWWLQFHDAELEKLIAQALRSNLDLLTAASRIRQAREEEISAGAPLLPSISANGSALRLHANSNPLAAIAGGSGASGAGSSGAGGSSAGGSSAGSASSGSSSGTPLGVTLYSLGFDASWELDVFGGTRRALQAARAGTEAAVWQLRDAEVSLSAEVATDYLELRSSQSRIRIVTDSVHSQEQLLTLARARARNGFVTELDVNQQLAQLASTRAEIPALEAEERALMHALAVLLAEEPQSLIAELSQAASIPAVPQSLPVGLPSELLRRRPDVRAAERQLARATAQEGVAVASLYPRFNLLGLAAFAGNSAGSLLSSSNFADAGLGMISWPLFEGGRLRANERAAREQRNQAYLAYRKSVLVALQEAEDALARYGAEQRRLLSLRTSESAARSSLNIAQAQYGAGLVTFINVLQASSTYLTAEDQVVQSTQALAQDLASLYKALGGGWAP